MHASASLALQKTVNLFAYQAGDVPVKPAQLRFRAVRHFHVDNFHIARVTPDCHCHQYGLRHLLHFWSGLLAAQVSSQFVSIGRSPSESANVLTIWPFFRLLSSLYRCHYAQRQSPSAFHSSFGFRICFELRISSFEFSPSLFTFHFSRFTRYATRNTQHATRRLSSTSALVFAFAPSRHSRQCLRDQYSP